MVLWPGRVNPSYNRAASFFLQRAFMLLNVCLPTSPETMRLGAAPEHLLLPRSAYWCGAGRIPWQRPRSLMQHCGDSGSLGVGEVKN